MDENILEKRNTGGMAARLKGWKTDGFYDGVLRRTEDGRIRSMGKVSKETEHPGSVSFFWLTRNVENCI